MQLLPLSAINIFLLLSKIIPYGALNKALLVVPSIFPTTPPAIVVTSLPVILRILLFPVSAIYRLLSESIAIPLQL